MGPWLNQKTKANLDSILLRNLLFGVDCIFDYDAKADHTTCSIQRPLNS